MATRKDNQEEGPFGNVSDDDVGFQPTDNPVVTPTYASKRVKGVRSVTINNQHDSLGDSNDPNSDPSNQNNPLYQNIPGCNTVSISQEDLDGYVQQIETLSKDLSDNMLNGESTFLLALESASTYVQSVLRDGMNIDAEVDTDIMSVVSDIGRLSIVFKALKHAKLPNCYKAKFFTVFITKMAEESCLTLIESRQSQKRKQEVNKRLRDLEVLVKQRRVDKSANIPDHRFSSTRNDRPTAPDNSISKHGVKKPRGAM